MLRTLTLIATALPSADPEAPPTPFYVDPDWRGTSTGEAASPWTSLDRAAWARVDRALAGANVVVYFAAGKTATRRLQVLRTDTSTHRLVLDGMSKVNTNGAAPVWAGNPGTDRFEIRSDYGIVTTQEPTKRSYVTIRGFKVTAGVGRRGGQGIYYWGGDHVVIEHCEVTHDKSCKHGPGILFGYAWKADGKPDNGGCTDLVIRGNVVHHVYGEGIYIGGSHNVDRPAHRNVTIERNLVYDVGAYGGEGDAIDIKDGSGNVVVRGNTLYMTKPGTMRDGVAMSSGGLIERNFIYHFGRAGITLGVYWNTFAARKDTIVRNNIVVHTGGNPRYSWDYGIIVSGKPAGDQYSGVAIYGNTIVGVRGDRPQSGIGLSVSRYATGAIVKNNITVGSAAFDFATDGAALAQHDHNLYYSPGRDTLIARFGRQRCTAKTLRQVEPHSLGVDPRFVRPTPPYRPDGFRLQPDSPAVGAGSPLGLHSHDFFGATRAPRWDIGAAQATASGKRALPTSH